MNYILDRKIFFIPYFRDRRVRILGLILCLLTSLSIFGQPQKYPLVRTPQDVAVNRSIPKNIISPGERMQAKFSKIPTDEEIFRVHFFEEPLVPQAGPTATDENSALVYALAGFSQRTNQEDFTSLTTFLKKYPKSRWRGSLLANLGIVYRRTGYYNQALDAWELSWKALKKQTEHKAKVLADRVVTELLLINAWVGRKGKIDSLLTEINKRVMEGPAADRIVSARAALWLMNNKPGISFKCGPYALNRIYMLLDSTKKVNDKLLAAQSTSKGFALSELETMAHDAGLKYLMAFRAPGAPVIPNSVVHWKLGHYSALLKFETGHYKCEDETAGTVYGHQFWLTPAALDSSASGYFLVPEAPLPQGWRKVTPAEGMKIFGKGQAPKNNDATSDDDINSGCGDHPPMAQCNIQLAAVSLHIYDRPVYYNPPVGLPINWDIQYHQRDSRQPSNFTYSNFGPRWTFNWLSYIQDNPTNASANADLYVKGGGFRTFNLFNAQTQSYAPERQTNDILVRVCPTCYELRHPDGSKEIYSTSDGGTSVGRRIFLTQSVDPAGNAVTLMYDPNLRLTGIKDAVGQVTDILYENSLDIYKITSIRDPFKRSASFEYDGQGRMNKITDMIGIVSSFKYEPDGFINQMSTPYGATKFTREEGPGNYTALEIHYPLGEKERAEFNEDAIAGSESPGTLMPAGLNFQNSYLNYRNTFFWDKKAMKEGPGDYTKAHIYHWLHGLASMDENGSASPILESFKKPLENRVWYRYQGQGSSSYSSSEGMSAKPSIIARVLDDGTTQVSKFAFNSLGTDTVFTDPLGRQLTYIYDTNKIDLKEVRQTKTTANDLLAKFTYNNQHLPLTATDASGLSTTFTYNSAGQLQTVINPKHETTTLAYNSSGYLQTIAGPVASSVTSFTYDLFGRVRTVTDPEGYTVTTDYDAINRPTVITYPDSTFEQIVYDRLDAVHMKDRMGRWSHNVYDSLDRPNIIQDALGRITQLIWCSCGSLAEIVDPLKQVTTFVRDLQGRVVSKIYNDGKSIHYTYENTSGRLKQVTDAKGQNTQYSYFIDDNLKQVDYTNAVVATPSVAYTYDTVYNRIATMTDGTGLTTYAYNGVSTGPGSGQLASVDGPQPSNDLITYSYDSLGRKNGRSAGGVGSSVIFDSLGRITTASNALGSFAYSYVNQTQRLLSVGMPNGQSTSFAYFDNGGDQRLKQIMNKATGGATLSKFDYDYNREGQITKWTQQAGSAAPVEYALGYDLSDQLISATLKNQSTSAIVKRYAYQYDKAGNRTSEQIDNSVTSAAYNNVNQLTRQENNGPMRFAGTVSEFSSVSVKNLLTSDSTIARVDTTNSFEAFLKVSPGTNNIAITATDYSGNNNRAINNYSIAVTPGVANTLNYDDNGNTIFSAASAATYEWDALDRLVKITSAAGITEFVYDGLSRRVAEKLNGVFIKRWLWDGTEMLEERDAGGATVTKRFFDQGEQINGVNYYFTKDHLGSIREMTDINGAVQARYDYDPYGRRTKVLGTIDADFGFTGHYYHASSGLYLTVYRAYDVNRGRWLNRDPIKEIGGLNLYAYVNGNPINGIDPLGWASHPMPKNLDNCNCDELAALAQSLQNHIEGRFKDMLEDKWGLYNGNNPEKGTWKGHQQAYSDSQKQLGKVYNKLNDKGCGNKITADMEEWATKPAPKSPNPKDNSESIWSTVGIIGTGVLVVGTLIIITISTGGWGLAGALAF